MVWAGGNAPRCPDSGPFPSHREAQKDARATLGIWKCIPRCPILARRNGAPNTTYSVVNLHNILSVLALILGLRVGAMPLFGMPLKSQADVDAPRRGFAASVNIFPRRRLPAGLVSPNRVECGAGKTPARPDCSDVKLNGTSRQAVPVDQRKKPRTRRGFRHPAPAHCKAGGSEDTQDP